MRRIVVASRQIWARLFPSRLRKNGLRDLDSLRSRDFVIREGLWLHLQVSGADSLSGLRAHLDPGLRRLNRQIPQTD
jgi:hypothetical protein